METVDRSADGLAWREAGAGDVVLLLHGLGGTRTSWEPQLSALSADRRCVAWDMPGYGASDVIEPLTFGKVADRVVDLIDLLGVDCVDLVGLSFGGMHALHTALRHPGRVRRLVLSNTSARFGADGTTAEAWTTSRLAPLDSGASLHDLAPTVLDSLVGSPLRSDARARLIDGFGRITEPGFRAAVGCLPSHDVLDRLGEIDHPSLVVVGELDRETPPSYGRTIADRLPNATLVELDGVGHLAPSEAPHMFNALVAEFLLQPEGATT